jgi:hypothetical protein
MQIEIKGGGGLCLHSLFFFGTVSISNLCLVPVSFLSLLATSVPRPLAESTVTYPLVYFLLLHLFFIYSLW